MIFTKLIMRIHSMSKENSNKAVVGRWFTEFWGKNVSLAVIDEIAAPNMLLKYSLHEPRHGRAITSLVSGKVVVPIRVTPSTTFLLVAFRLQLAARCTSPVPLC
jgi:hypothetical protein